MYAVISPTKIQMSPGMVLRSPATWEEYVELADSRGDRSLPRIKYCSGEMRIMSPMPKHGREANLLADIVKILLDCQTRSYEAFTPVTMQIPDESGIEPDYCFYIDHWQAIVGRDRINWQIDPPPDLVIEIDVTSYSDVNDYLPYAVPEVWLFKNKNLMIYALQAGTYQRQFVSQYFPDVDLMPLITDCLERSSTQGTGAVLRELRISLQKE